VLAVAANPADNEAALPAPTGALLLGEGAISEGTLRLPPRSVAIFYQEESHG
jgi:hypothetical protein